MNHRKLMLQKYEKELVSRALITDTPGIMISGYDVNGNYISNMKCNITAGVPYISDIFLSFEEVEDEVIITFPGISHDVPLEAYLNWNGKFLQSTTEFYPIDKNGKYAGHTLVINCPRKLTERSINSCYFPSSISLFNKDASYSLKSVMDDNKWKSYNPSYGILNTRMKGNEYELGTPLLRDIVKHFVRKRIIYPCEVDYHISKHCGKDYAISFDKSFGVVPIDTNSDEEYEFETVTILTNLSSNREVKEWGGIIPVLSEGYIIKFCKQDERHCIITVISSNLFDKLCAKK